MSTNKELVPELLSSKQENRKKDASSLVPISRDSKELPELRRKSSATGNWKHPHTSLRNDFIPEEIFVALTSAASPVPCPSYLKPPKKTKHMKDFPVHGCLRTADGVWQHPVRRNKFRYLIQHPICLTGAGRDVSFLYDIIAEKERRNPPPTPVLDKTASEETSQKKSVTARAPKNIAESLVPQEFHIVKNRGVIGLEYYDDKYTTLLEDCENKLRVFPSLKPSGRLEVIQLMKVMDTMLEKAGVDNEETGITGLSAMQNILEVLKVEQNIYNIVFHEIIRQVSVDCIERGELLSRLRQRYVELLNRIPRQIRNLYNEMMAQRVMDRHITDELFTFKEAVGNLTRELLIAREHAQKATIEAELARKKLAKVIWDAELNVNLLDEYRELYELQRARLEAQIHQLTQEKELWSGAAYDLALKVIEKNNVILARRLYDSEKAWTSVMRHFTELLASEDDMDLSSLQQLTQEFQDLLSSIDTEVKQAEDYSREQFSIIQAGLEGWLTYFRDHILGRGVCTSEKGASLLDNIMEDLKEWENILNKQLELLGGEEQLRRKEPMETATTLQKQWVELGRSVLLRHKTLDGKMPPEWKQLEHLDKMCRTLCQQYFLRITGENGVSRILTSLVSSWEDWTFRLLASSEKSAICASDWLKFFQTMNDWLVQLAELLKLTGTTESPEHRRLKIISFPVELEYTSKKIQQWVGTTTSGTEKGNIQLAQEMTEFHNTLNKWMVNLLLYMIPDYTSCDSVPLPDAEIARREDRRLLDIFRLEGEAKSLATKMSKFSSYIFSGCKEMVTSITAKKLDNFDPDAEYELRYLEKIKTECLDWIQTSGLLLSGMKTTPTTLISTKELIKLFGAEALQPKHQLPPHPEQSTDYSHDDQEETTEEQKKDQAQEYVTKETVAEKQVLETEQPPSEPSTSTPLSPSTDQQDMCADVVHTVRYIGPDSNVHARSMETEEVTVSGRELYASQWTTKYSKMEFQMLASLEILEERLLEAEKRAQQAEEKSESLHEQLEEALSKLQDLGNEKRAEEETSSAKTSLSTSVDTPSKTKTRTKTKKAAKPKR